MTSRSSNRKPQKPVSEVDDDFEEIEDVESEEDKPEPSTMNDFVLMTGNNAFNHTTSMAGLASYVHPLQHPTFRTKDAAYRFAAFLITMAEALPNETEFDYTFEEVLEAVRNS